MNLDPAPGSGPATVTRLDATARSLLLNLLLGAIALMSAAAAIGSVTTLVDALQNPEATVAVQLTDTARAQAAGAVTGLSAGTALTLNEDGYPMLLTAADQSVGLRLLTAAGSSLTLACLAVSGLLVFLTLRGIRGGHPFDAVNATRLRVVGLLVVIGGLGGQMLDNAARIAVLDSVGLSDPGSPIELSFSVSMAWVLAGICALALGEAFAHGRRLSEELEGVI